MREIKKILPHRIKFSLNVEMVKPVATKRVLTNATEKKIELIREVKALHESGCCFREIERRIGLNRKTVSRYVKFDNVEDTAIYSVNNRTSQLDEHEELIREILTTVT